MNAWGNGFLGMLIFSATLPATRIAVMDLDPLFLTVGRAAIAGFLALLLLMVFQQKTPDRNVLASLSVVACGVIVGFPLLTSLALRHVPSAHAMVFIGLLPVATAFFGVLRGGDRPQWPFWLFSALGSAFVMGYALREGLSLSPIGDAMMIGAILCAGIGYAEGARISRQLGGWQVICWALVLALPVMLPISLMTQPISWGGVGGPALLALAYVSVFSMLVGFIFWYRGLAAGGIAKIAQLQLLQPFFGIALAALLLGEEIGWPLIGVTAAVVLCVAGARRYA